MRQDVRLHNYYYGCSRGPSVLLIVRVAQVSYWCHHCDYDLILASINIYPPCLILNLVYITSPQQPNDGRPHLFANYVRSHLGLHLGGVLSLHIFVRLVGIAES